MAVSKALQLKDVQLKFKNDNPPRNTIGQIAENCLELEAFDFETFEFDGHYYEYNDNCNEYLLDPDQFILMDGTMKFVKNLLTKIGINLKSLKLVLPTLSDVIPHIAKHCQNLTDLCLGSNVREPSEEPSIKYLVQLKNL
jgi:hypothetical protein